MTPMIKHATVTMVALGLIAGGAVSGTAFAQNDEPVPMYRIPGTSPEPERFNRNVPGLGERTFNILTSIHEDIGEQRYAEALERLRGLQESGRGTDYEKAVILRNIAHVLAVMDRTDEAKRVAAEVTALDALPHGDTQAIFLMLASLHAMDEEWERSIEVMRRYFYWEEKPSTDALQIMAVAAASLERYRDTITWAKRLIDNAKTPREDSYVLWLWGHSELKEYEEAVEVLKQIVPLWPDKVVYWEQLAGLLMELEREPESLAVYSVAYQRGLLKDESKIKNLVQYYLVREAPYKAARILQTALENESVESTEDNWQLLSDAFNYAQEIPESIRAQQRAAALSDDGELYLREAQMHSQTDNWVGVETAVRNAIEKGGLKRPGRAWQLRGMAAYERDDLQAALRMFREAAQFDDTRRNANMWIQYINNEIRVERALREGV